MPDTIELEYDLLSLPTAQHRAGLAGLVIAIDTMHRRRLPDVPEVEVKDQWTVRLTLTEATLTALLNDVYDATMEEVRSPKVWKKQNVPIQPKRTETETSIEPRTRKERTRTTYIYDEVRPKAPVLLALGMPPVWIKLWHKAIWETLRGQPTTREPYKQRANCGPVSDAADLWKGLVQWKQESVRGGWKSADIAGPLYLGAQSVTAERVPFTGNLDQNLLLHCWPLVMGVGEAQVIHWKDDAPKTETTGLVLTIPDVIDVKGFAAEYPAVIGSLSPELAGYRPRDAVLALPEEGGLQYLEHLAALTRARALAGEMRFTVSAIEVYHLTKRGNNIAVLGSGRVPARADIVEQFGAIQRRYRHLAFRAQLVRNLLHERPWYAGFDHLFAIENSDLFLGESGRWFAFDVNRKFQTEFAR